MSAFSDYLHWAEDDCGVHATVAQPGEVGRGPDCVGGGGYGQGAPPGTAETVGGVTGFLGGGGARGSTGADQCTPTRQRQLNPHHKTYMHNAKSDYGHTQWDTTSYLPFGVTILKGGSDISYTTEKS